MVVRSDSIGAADAQATTETLVAAPLIHNPRGRSKGITSLGRSNTTPGGKHNHKHTTYDKMHVIVKAAAFAAAKEQQGCQQGGIEEYHLETPFTVYGLPKTKFDVMCDVASAHRATASISVRAEEDCVPSKITSMRPQKLKPKSSLISPMRIFSSAQASEFVPAVVHRPVVYYSQYPKYNTQHDEALVMRSSPAGLHFHPPTQQQANISGPRQPSTTPRLQLVPTIMPMPTMMMMPQLHPMTMMAAPVNTASASGFLLPFQQQQAMMPILSAYPSMMFPPVGWVAGGQESQLPSPMNHPSYTLGMSCPIQLQQQSLHSFPAACSTFTPSRSTAQHVLASRKSAARPKTTSQPRKSSPQAQTGGSENKTRFSTPPTIVHQPIEFCYKKSKQQIKKTKMMK